MAGIETAAMHEATSRDDPGPGAVRRPWGRFEELAAGPSYKVKRLYVMARQQLWLQTYAEREDDIVRLQDDYGRAPSPGR
jgi:hypothetical protein